MTSTHHTTTGRPVLRPERRYGPVAWAGRNKWYLLGGLIVLLIAFLIYRAVSHPAEPAGGRFAGAPMAVNVAKVEKGDVPVILNALGTVTPLQNVTVRTQINGQLQQIAFTEGQMVKKGDFLAEVDPRPYLAALEQAQGTLAKDQAQLKNAQLDAERYVKLVQQDSIASQTRDTQLALVRQLQGQVETDKAAVDSAKVNLDYCHIISPVTGRVGLRQVDQGNYVTPGDTNGIVVVTQLQPMSVIFVLPEDNVLAVTKPSHAGQTLMASAYAKDDKVQTDATRLALGKLTNIDNQIDTTTGTFKLRAQFDNTDESLFPNQFVNIQLLVDTKRDQMVVPTSAIQRGAPGTFVYLVGADSTVSVRSIKLGVAQGERQAVVSGLAIGDQVVTDGVDRLRDGAKVILPGAQPPAPGDASGGGRHHHRQNSDGTQSGEQGQTGKATDGKGGNGDSSGGRQPQQ